MTRSFSENANQQLRKLCQLKPDTYKRFLDFAEVVFEDGAISGKVKELMAITAAHVTQCRLCIEEHVKRAKRKGVSDEEIAEAVWVAAEMRAGAAFGHGAIAMAVAGEHSHQESGH